MNSTDDGAFFLGEIRVFLGGHGREATEPMVEAYWRVLGHLSRDDLRAAIKSCLCGDGTWPTPGLVLAAAPGKVNHAESWGQVRAAIRRFGWDQGGDAQDALSRAQWRAINGLGGWRRLCSCESTELDHLGRTYRELIDSAERAEAQNPPPPKRALPPVTSFAALAQSWEPARLEQKKEEWPERGTPGTAAAFKSSLRGGKI